MNQFTADFVECFEEAILDFYSVAGDVTLEFVRELFDGPNGFQHQNDFYKIDLNAIRQYCDDMAEAAYDRRIEAMYG